MQIANCKLSIDDLHFAIGILQLALCHLFKTLGASAPLREISFCLFFAYLTALSAAESVAGPGEPDAAKVVLDALGVPDENRMWPEPADKGVWDALPRGLKINPPDVLFKKIEDADIAAWSERFHGGA